MKELFDRLEEARKRGGEASEQRPEGVERLLEETETLGYQQGEPLGNVDSYDAYPAEPEEFYQPQTGSLLQSIADSDAVHDLIDLGEELDMLVYKEGAGATTLESAVDLHGISGLPASVPDAEKEDSTIQVPDGEGDTLSIAKEAPDWPTAYHMYVTLGMSVDEMATVLDIPYNAVYSTMSDYGMV